MSAVTGSGTAGARALRLPLSVAGRAASVADLLAEESDTFLESYLDDTTHLTEGDYRAELTRQVRQARVVPVYFGSAITGEGVGELLRAIREFLPQAAGDPAARLRASVFKIDWASGGEKVAYARVHSGRLTAREPVDTYRRGRTGEMIGGNGKVTSVRVFAHGTTTHGRPPGPATSPRCTGWRTCRSATSSARPKDCRPAASSRRPAWRPSSGPPNPRRTPSSTSACNGWPRRTR